MNQIFSRLGIALALSSIFTGCQTTYERRDPTGETFPSVLGTALDDRVVTIPDDFSGQETLLFVGYKMESQFDIDRWLLALNESGVSVSIYELPTIPGLIPGLFARVIDDGMRSGIPEDDWAIVVTIYDDAKVVARFLGNATPLPARVVLLDGDGRVAFFHDRGFSIETLLRLKEALKQVRSEPLASTPKVR